MDFYTKAVLTVIAAALAAIALKLWMPPPTLGDLMDLSEASDPDAAVKLIRRIPLARVQGTVDVGGSVSIDR